MYEGNYKENVISYNAQMLPIAGHSISEIKNNALEKSEKIAQDDEFFESVPDRYQSLVPTERYSSMKGGIEANINAAYDTITAKIKAITNAIIDYCNGDEIFSPENQVVLDELINNVPKGGSPKDPPTGAPAQDPPKELEEPTITPPTNEDQVPVTPTETDKNIDDLNTNLPDNANNNESPFTPQVGGTTTQNTNNNTEGEALTETSSDENKETDTALTESTSSLFSVPMPTSISRENIKKSSVAAPLGITIAAAAAIGGKIYYDAKKEKEEEEMAEMDSSSSQDKEEKFLIDKGFVSGVNSVKLKKDLINDAEVKEDE